MHHLEVRSPLLAAQVVHLAGPASLEGQLQDPAVIFHVQPLADLLSLAIYRQRTILQRIRRHKRNELFRMLIGSVVVARTGEDYRKAVGLKIGAGQQVAAGLAGGIRAVRLQGSGFGKLPLGFESPVHFIGADVQETRDAFAPRRLQKPVRSENVGLNKDFCGINAAVHMGFRRKVDHRVHSLHQVFQTRVADVPADQLPSRRHPFEICPVPGIGQFIEVCDAVSRVPLQPVADEIGTNKTRPAGYKKFHSAPQRNRTPARWQPLP